MTPRVTVVGGGMAGSEAAWQLAEVGLDVSLVEMKPCAMSPAHQSPLLGELVCSNSLRSDDPVAPAGLLKQELRRCGSLVIACADRHRVPAGRRSPWSGSGSRARSRSGSRCTRGSGSSAGGSTSCQPGR